MRLDENEGRDGKRKQKPCFCFQYIVGDHFFSILNVPVASDLTSVLVSWPTLNGHVFVFCHVRGFSCICEG